MRILFIGGGNMARALIGGLLARGYRGDAIDVVEIADAQREALRALGVEAHATIDAPALADEHGALNAQTIVLAVKPQQMREAVGALAPRLGTQLVVSIAAGVRAADLSRWLGGYRRIVRAMPNTPALIGRGITGLAAFGELAPEDRRAAESIAAAVGETVWVDDDTQLDTVTAVSGSGPAYAFLLIEAMAAAGERLGLKPEHARRLAIHTVGGAAELAARSDEAPATLRERVTSKGGTTAAALAVMSARDLPKIVDAAIEAASRRSAELGDEFGRG